MFANKLPINIEDLLHQRRVESERIEYKENWNPEAVSSSACASKTDNQKCRQRDWMRHNWTKSKKNC